MYLHLAQAKKNEHLVEDSCVWENLLEYVLLLTPFGVGAPHNRPDHLVLTPSTATIPVLFDGCSEIPFSTTWGWMVLKTKRR